MSNTAPNQNNFVRLATNGLFVVILAFGLSISSKILLPLSDFFVDPIIWYKATILSLPYVIIITSWMGFMQSVEKDPYLLGSWGKSRFVIDLLILLIYYLLLAIVSNDDLLDDNQMFILIPVVFTFYFIWDFFKEKEYKNDTKKLETIKRRTDITRKYLFATIITSISYFILNVLFFHLSWNNVEFWINALNWHVEGWTHFLTLNIIFVGIFLFLVIRYRYAKIDKQRHRRVT
jgi:hypothetical protein